MTFSYSSSLLVKLQGTLSPDRLATYVSLAGASLPDGIRLYVRNVALSEAFYGPLHGVEIVVRNALNNRLSVAFGPAWYDSPRCGLEHAQREKIDQAKNVLLSEAKPLAPPSVIAQLSFGFWTGILGRKYETALWRPHLRLAFPNGPKPMLRRHAHSALDRIRRLRNRIMHHEPIISRDLKTDHELILTVIGWVCPETRTWVEHLSRFHAVFDNEIQSRPLIAAKSATLR